MNKNELRRTGGVVHPTEIKPYIERPHHRLKYLVPKDDHIHSPGFTFYPCDFFCDPSKIIPRVFDRDFDALPDRCGGEVNLDGG